MATQIRRGAGELLSSGYDPEILYVGILISDVGKEKELIENNKWRYSNSSFRAFLDHSRISMREVNEIRKEMKISSSTWRKILRVIVGHDGPSVDGSWWKAHYEKEIGKKYARLYGKEALIHCYLDRLDQGSVFLDQNKRLNGGLKKISYDLLKSESFHDHSGKSDLGKIIYEIFGEVVKGSALQIEELEQRLKPQILKKVGLPSFVEEQLRRFKRISELREYISVQHPTRESGSPSRVWVKNHQGFSEEVFHLDEFWKNLSQVVSDAENGGGPLVST